MADLPTTQFPNSEYSGGSGMLFAHIFLCGFATMPDSILFYYY